MKKIVSIILFSSLLVGCSNVEPTSDDEQQEIISSEVKDSGFEFTRGVDGSNISYADEKNHVNVEGISHTGNNIYVIYNLTVIDKIQPDEDGSFEYYSKSTNENTRYVFSDDKNLSLGDSNINVSDLQYSKTINVQPNKNYLAALEEEEDKAKAESESIVAEEEAMAQAEAESESTSVESQPAIESKAAESSLNESGEVPEEDSKQDISREYENALNNAYDYLNYTSFSKQGLYDQLIFEGYPENAAQYAVDNVNTDWKENALEAAKGYLDYTSFSKLGLYEQLIFEGHPESDAQYAVDNVNTDWNKNALETAINYLDFTSFSDQGLYDQLLFEGYSSSQAQYAIDNLP